MGIIDTSIDRLLRGRHVERLHETIENYRDQATQAALSGTPKRAHYYEQWADDAQREIDWVLQEPLRRALDQS